MPFLQRGRYEPVAAFRQRLKYSVSCMAMVCGQRAADPRFVKFYAELQREYRERAAERAANMEFTDDCVA
jgi:hypothetical protein